MLLLSDHVSSVFFFPFPKSLKKTSCYSRVLSYICVMLKVKQLICVLLTNIVQLSCQLVIMYAVHLLWLVPSFIQGLPG